MFRAPVFLSATTAKGLQQAMLANNIKHGMEFAYFDIQFAKGRFYAWYFIDQRKDVEAKISKARQKRSGDD